MPFQPVASKPVTPASSIVGTSGRPGVRLSAVTAIGRSCPALMPGMAASGSANDSWTSPPISAVTAGPPPLNGTCTMSRPVMVLNSSPARWGRLPLPAELKKNFPGCALMSAISSASVLAGTEGCTTRMLVTEVMSVIGARSLGSNGIAL